MSQMSLMPYFTQQFFDNSGDPLAGGKLYFYEPGTSSLKTVYNDSNGTTALSNPVILDSSGRTQIFLDGYYKIVMKDANDVTIDTLDNVSSQYFNSSTFTQWLNREESLTYISANQFSVSGDETANYAIGRRITANVTAGTIFGTISNSSSSGNPAVTTIAIIWDSGNMDSGLSSVGLGIITPSNNSLPIISTENKTANYTMVKSDNKKILTFDSNSAITFSLLSANNVPKGFMCGIKNKGEGTLLVSGNVDNSNNFNLRTSEGAMIFSDSSEWMSFGQPALPIGAIIWLHKSLSGVPQTLPWGYVECNGQTLDDADSHLNGQVIPNINGVGYFIRGSNVSGTIQANQNLSHTHSLDSSNITGNMSLTSASAGALASGNAANWALDANSAYGIQVTYDEVVLPLSNLASQLFAANKLTLNNTGNTESRPINISMVAIMKVK